jgi:rhodanese-related sulfurtransferase
MRGQIPDHFRALLASTYPFYLLSDHRLEEALASLTRFDLGASERVTLEGRRASDLLYVLEGNVILCTERGDEISTDAGVTLTKPIEIAPAPSVVVITARTPAIVCRGHGDVLDYLITWETFAAGMFEGRGVAPTRLAVVRHSLAFRRVPLECVEQAFRRMHRIYVRKGEAIVRQGEPGDAFYLIESGEAEVWQTGIFDDEPRKVAERGVGEAFGEEALVLRGRRSATVRMMTDGALLVLDKRDFDELIGRPMIEQVEPPVAKALLEGGCFALDVRYAEEYEEGHIPGSVLVPLNELRDRFSDLDPSRKYVVCCRGGGRSSVGTLLLRQRGYQAVSLKGGMGAWAYEVVGGPASEHNDS